MCARVLGSKTILHWDKEIVFVEKFHYSFAKNFLKNFTEGIQKTYTSVKPVFVVKKHTEERKTDERMSDWIEDWIQAKVSISEGSDPNFNKFDAAEGESGAPGTYQRKHKVVATKKKCFFIWNKDIMRKKKTKRLPLWVQIKTPLTELPFEIYPSLPWFIDYLISRVENSPFFIFSKKTTEHFSDGIVSKGFLSRFLVFYNLLGTKNFLKSLNVTFFK